MGSIIIQAPPSILISLSRRHSPRLVMQTADVVIPGAIPALRSAHVAEQQSTTACLKFFRTQIVGTDPPLDLANTKSIIGTPIHVIAAEVDVTPQEPGLNIQKNTPRAPIANGMISGTTKIPVEEGEGIKFEVMMMKFSHAWLT
jgi:hypothetical protein